MKIIAKNNQFGAIVIPDELIMNKILFVRGLKVMIDSDLAELYGVTTKRLNEQVKRNIKRFPEDFMFQLTETEKQQVVANCDHLKNLKFSPYLPFVFTEHGAVMLATHKDILHKLEQIEKKGIEQDQKIMLIFEYLKQLEQVKQSEPEQGPRKVIKGYKKDKE